MVRSLQLAQNCKTVTAKNQLTATKPYRCGLVVGKFSPLHRGHEYLLTTAQQQCDKLIVISYSRPEFAGCSRALRHQWLTEFIPDASILVIDAPAIERQIAQGVWQFPMPTNSASDETHRTFTAELLRCKLQATIDVVFTSEDYGEGFAQYLSVKGLAINNNVSHNCVDKSRFAHPISGSFVRKDLLNAAYYLSAKVLAHYKVKTVCILGGESSGKTTLCQSLAAHWQDPMACEYGRTLWEEKTGY